MKCMTYTCEAKIKRMVATTGTWDMGYMTHGINGIVRTRLKSNLLPRLMKARFRVLIMYESKINESNYHD